MQKETHRAAQELRRKDGGSPIEDVRWGMKIIQRGYESQHAEKSFSFYIEAGSGHVLSNEMWKRTKDFFGRHLKTA